MHVNSISLVWAEMRRNTVERRVRCSFNPIPHPIPNRTEKRPMRIIRTLLMAIAAASCSVALAVEVSQADARIAAQSWIARGGKRLTASFEGQGEFRSTKTLFDDVGKPVCHAFETAEGGFVVMSADSMLPPVIAFSSKRGVGLGDRGTPFVEFLIEDMRRRMSSLGANSRKHASASTVAANSGARFVEDRGFRDEWDALRAPKAERDGQAAPKMARAEISEVRVAPIVEARWGQDAWNRLPTFNYYTPNNYVCGCVATAVAQVMRHWREPSQPVSRDVYRCWIDGEETEMTMLGGVYQWEQMPLTEDECTSEDERKALGHLLYDVGVASQMQWSSDGSGTWGAVAAKGLRESFGYASASSYILAKPLKRNISTNDGIRSAILGSLDAGMPVVIGVTSNRAGGHEVVVDGYGFCGDSLVYCHVNCGWDGSSQDAWYNLIGEPLTQSYGFSELDDVVYNIHPSETGSVVSGRVLDKSGNPVAGAVVTIVSEAGDSQETLSNDKGIYVFRTGEEGTFKVSAENGNLVSNLREITVGQCVDTQWSITDDAYLTYSTSGKAAGAIGNVWGVDLTLNPKKTVYCIVRFDANGGYVSESIRYVAKGTAIGALPVPNSADNVFNGWMTAREGGSIVQSEDTVENDVTLYACWSESQVEWDFVVDGDSATVTGVTGAKGDLIVPSSLGGFPVRSIGNRAFECCDALRKVKLADSITNIGERAFFFCRGMTNVEIPASILNIDVAAFEGCVALTKLWIPSGIEQVSPRAFKGCRRLNAAYLPNVLRNMICEGTPDYVFDDCDDALNVVFYDPDGLYSIRFHRNDGTGLSQETLFVYGEKTRMPALRNGLDWVRPNYEFLGWATSVANVTARKIWKQDWAYVAKPVDPGKTLNAYAVWDVASPYAYTIVFNKNDGSGQSQSVRFLYGEKTRLPSVANGLGWHRPGYRFVGWATGTKIWKPDWAYVERPVGIGQTLTVYAVWGK